MKQISILGCTGSIGTSTLAVVAEFPEEFQVKALCAGRNVDLLAEQVQRFSPELAVVQDAAAADSLRRCLPADPAVEIMHGEDGYRSAATLNQVEVVVSAMVGAAGLAPTVAAIRAGKTVALANKEVLVMAGGLVMDLVAEKNCALLPVDSEHSAIFQCLAGQDRKALDRIHLTASGGPFLQTSRQQMAAATPADALAHPTWTMGQKISIDSATLMNKGLEVIEACWLFQVPPEMIEVVVHPQSIIHSMVSFADGAVLAQLGAPDMKGAIAYALSYPRRLPLDLPRLDLAALGQLTFQYPDTQRFPCLRLAFEACRQGRTYPAVLNAANEVAVAAFLAQQLDFFGIAGVIEETLAAHAAVSQPDWPDIKAADQWARQHVGQLLPGTPVPPNR